MSSWFLMHTASPGSVCLPLDRMTGADSTIPRKFQFPNVPKSATLFFNPTSESQPRKKVRKQKQKKKRKKEEKKKKEKRIGRAGSQGLGPELRRDAMLTTRRQPRITNGRSLLASRHRSICHPESIRPGCMKDLGVTHPPLHFLMSRSFSSRISNRHTAPIRNAVSHSKQRAGTLSNRNKTTLFVCRVFGDFR